MYNCNNNQNYFIKENRSTSRVTHPPGGYSSFTIGMDILASPSPRNNIQQRTGYVENNVQSRIGKSNIISPRVRESIAADNAEVSTSARFHKVNPLLENSRNSGGDTLDNLLASERCTIPGLENHYQSLSMNASHKVSSIRNDPGNRVVTDKNAGAGVADVDRRQNIRNEFQQNGLNSSSRGLGLLGNSVRAAESNPRYCRATVAPPGGHSSLSLAWNT